MNNIDPLRVGIFVVGFTGLAIGLSFLPDEGPRHWLKELQGEEISPRKQSIRERATIPEPRTQAPEPKAETIVRVPEPERRAEKEAREREAQLREEAAAQKASQEEAERKRKAAEEAAAAHERYLARYLNQTAVRKPGSKTVAIISAGENGRLNRPLNEAVANRLTGEGIQIVPSFFKPEFVSDGLFDRALRDTTEVFKNLELSKSLDFLVLARQTVEYSSNPSLENIITATMELELTAYPTDAHAELRSWRYRAFGAGFNQADARAIAEERIIKQITNDTNMSLAPLFAH